MTIQEAITNVAQVVANARMTQQEHDILKQSIQEIAKACKERDALLLDKQEKRTEN